MPLGITCKVLLENVFFSIDKQSDLINVGNCFDIKTLLKKLQKVLLYLDYQINRIHFIFINMFNLTLTCLGYPIYKMYF